MLKLTDNKVYINNNYAGLIYNMVFYKEVEPNHFFVMFNGYGISKEILDFLTTHGIENIEIKSKTKIHRTTVSTYLNRGMPYTDMSKGFIDDQQVLSVSLMSKEEIK